VLFSGTDSGGGSGVQLSLEGTYISRRSGVAWTFTHESGDLYHVAQDLECRRLEYYKLTHIPRAGRDAQVMLASSTGGSSKSGTVTSSDIRFADGDSWYKRSPAPFRAGLCSFLEKQHVAAS
jgi:hypothetical protein